MPLGVRLDMKNNNALISVAMLSAFLDNQKDYLDMISPFVLNELKGHIGDKIDEKAIQEKMRAEYGFEDIPIHVIDKILNRASKGETATVKREKGKFYIISPVDNKKFIQNRKKMDSLIKQVLAALKEYWTANTKIDIGKAENVLITFLETYGYTVKDNIDNLGNLTISKDRNNYLVARFILDEYKNKTQIFENILEIIKGFFVYKSIYFFSTEQKKDIKSKLKGTEVYFDTKLLIYALGYNREEDKRATSELIDLIRENNGVVRTFPQHRDEVAGIMTKYAKDPLSRGMLSLEYFRKNNYDMANILRLRDSLDKNLLEIKIEVKEPPLYGNITDSRIYDDSFLDLSKLKKSLKENVGYSSEDSNSLQNDVDAISDISRIRGKSHRCGIEKCNAIFATRNNRLVTTVYNEYRERFERGEINFLINDIELTAMLWLKSYDKKNDIPELTLLEAAYAACELTQPVLCSFEQKLQMLENENKIDRDSALLMRTERCSSEELLRITQNDPSLVTEEAVLRIRENIEKQIREPFNKENKKLREELENEKKISIQRAEEKADKARRKLERTFNILCKAFFAILTVVVLYANILMYSSQFQNRGIGALAALILIAICIISWMDYLKGPQSRIKAYIDKKAKEKWHFTYEQEMREYDKIKSGKGFSKSNL